MIAENDLLEAIEACQREQAPNAQTCIKLAAYITIYDHMYGHAPGYSGSGSEFSTLASRTDHETLISVLDGMMDTIATVCPKVYDMTMQKLKAHAR